jgi:serine/threonine-protein kinase RsbW
MAEPREIAFTVDSRLENVALVGAAVRGIGEELGFAAQERYDLELCAVEAVSNSIRHAYKGEAGHPVTVRVSTFDERVEIRVLDDGLPVPLENRTPGEIEVDPEDILSIPESGRGTYLIHTLMDRVEYGKDGGANLLLMVKSRTPGESGLSSTG